MKNIRDFVKDSRERLSSKPNKNVDDVVLIEYLDGIIIKMNEMIEWMDARYKKEGESERILYHDKR